MAVVGGAAVIFGTRRLERFLFGFFMRPFLPFALEFALLAPLVLGVHLPGIEPLYLFLAPWVLVVVAALNLPFLGQLFRACAMDIPTRRNHALEHATVHFLSTRGLRKIAGRASPAGFRISGGATPAQIREAFEGVRRTLRAGEPLPHVSRHCGSNRITAQALAMALLFAVTVASLVLRPSLAVRTGALVAVVLVFVVLRHVVGNWVQARLFMATDFADASIADVRNVRADHVEKRPVYFVETTIERA